MNAMIRDKMIPEVTIIGMGLFGTCEFVLRLYSAVGIHAFMTGISVVF